MARDYYYDVRGNKRTSENNDPLPLSEERIREFLTGVNKAQHRKEHPKKPRLYAVGPFLWEDRKVYAYTHYDYSKSEK